MNATEIIKAVMKDQVCSFVSLGEKLGYKSPSAVSDKMRRKTSMRVDMFVSMLEAMDCEITIKQRKGSKKTYRLTNDGLEEENEDQLTNSRREATMIYGYARVSTKGQDRYGNSLEEQEKALTDAGATVIYKDSFTGMMKHHPGLDELLGVLKEGDTLVVTKLDRIARSMTSGCELVQELLGRGIKLNVLNMGVLDDTSTGKLISSIFFAFAEFERDIIVQRTNEGKEVARAANPNYKDGRKRLKIDKEFARYYTEVQSGKITVCAACKKMGISRYTWYNRVKEIENTK